MVDAIRVIAAGDAVVAPSVTRRLIESFTKGVNITPPASLNDLTDREMEVLHPVAKGRSNAEIAGDLILGEATVKTHVGRVLMKLGLRDRVQAVVFAYETGLISPVMADRTPPQGAAHPSDRRWQEQAGRGR